MNHSPIVLVDYASISAAGTGVAAQWQALREGRSGLQKNDFPHSHLDTWIGRVNAADTYEFPARWQRWQSRNNALAALGLAESRLVEHLDALKTRFGAARIGAVIGSSTSNIEQTEQGYRALIDDRLPAAFHVPEVFNPHGPGMFVAAYTGIEGPCITLNTACSSSLKVFASASRWLRAGLVDAVLVGGIDSLALSVLHGFHSLQLVSTRHCRPFDQQRDGINLGEAAGYAILARADDVAEHSGIVLAGYGESSDAHHMSHPHPEGLGARHAVEAALQRAALMPSDIDYINLHGTATRANDEAEGNVIADIFGVDQPASSTKGWTGHTLGAAGIVEAIFAIESLRSGFLPRTLNLHTLDSEIRLQVLRENRDEGGALRYTMSNSFGFGGNNCSAIFGHLDTFQGA